MRLEVGQYDLNGLIFGQGTDIPVSAMDEGQYEVAGADYQQPLTDEIQFGQDYFAPSAVSFSMGVLTGKILPNYAGPMNLDRTVIPDGRDLLSLLRQAWRAEAVRKSWGRTMELRYRRPYGERRIYGRPRKFQAASYTRKQEFVPVVADFARSDSFSYNEYESSTFMVAGGTASLARSGGDAPSWINMLIVGPVVNPRIVIGNKTIVLNTTVGAGKVVQLSSYPWERRVVSSDNVNLSPALASPFLDELSLQPNATVACSFTGSSTTAATAVAIYWREAYYDM